MTKNIRISIRTRLLNLAKEEKQEYMKVLVRYLHERLLFRATRNIWWRAFLKKIRWKERIDFSVVMECIKENLQPYWNEETFG